VPEAIDVLRLIHDHEAIVILGAVPTLLLIRHGRTTANASGTLAGHLPGIGLDERRPQQAARLAERLAPCPYAAWSPARCSAPSRPPR
jgi:broad specificity phosphatase PhoE